MNFTMKRKRRSEVSPEKEANSAPVKSDTSPDEDELDDMPTPILARKRKRRSSTDSHSVFSVSICPKDAASNIKKSKRMSIVSLFTTPIKPVLRIGASLQGSNGKSCDLDEPVVPQRKSLLRRSCSILRTSMGPPPLPSAPVRSSTPQRLARSWSQSVASLGSCLMSHAEIKRQEAIHELFSGEAAIVQDLELVTTTYRSSLLQLNILTEDEIECIFGNLDSLHQLHSSLRDKLQALRDASGVVKSVGNVLLQWIPGLESYMSYCARHLKAKAVLDEKKETNKRFQDFLQRCLESPFSRKLDLWTFLDFPRNRIVKYPILIGEILRHTPETHQDCVLLPQANLLLRCLLQKADRVMGEAECRHTVARLVWPNDVTECLEDATTVLCEGDLRDERGAKFHCLLFNVGFIITRADKRSDRLQVVSALIPAADLELEEIQPLRTSRNSTRCFRVGSRSDSTRAASYVFTAGNEHSRKHWMDSIKHLQQSTGVANIPLPPSTPETPRAKDDQPKECGL